MIINKTKLEVNGSVYLLKENKPIYRSPFEGQGYVYATPQLNGGLIFEHSFLLPTWNAGKGGWYNGKSRAIIQYLFKDNEYTSIMRIETKHELDTIYDDLQLIHDITVPNQIFNITLSPGVYRIELKAGSGGDGGGGVVWSGGNRVLNGGQGHEGEIKTMPLIVTAETTYSFILGGDGKNGYQGVEVAGHGGGASGGASVFRLASGGGYILHTRGGAGGGGAANGFGGWFYGAGGGGGARGFGKGGAGENLWIGNGYATGGAGGNENEGGEAGQARLVDAHTGAHCVHVQNGNPGSDIISTTEPKLFTRGGSGGNASFVSWHPIIFNPQNNPLNCVFRHGGLGGDDLLNTSSGFVRVFR